MAKRRRKMITTTTMTMTMTTRTMTTIQPWVTNGMDKGTVLGPSRTPEKERKPMKIGRLSSAISRASAKDFFPNPEIVRRNVYDMKMAFGEKRSGEWVGGLWFGGW